LLLSRGRETWSKTVAGNVFDVDLLEWEKTVALIIASALVVGLASLAVLLWALSSGQYDDLDGDAQRILMDDDLSD
jgi:cbb3-type cytochrome oxidase maturation protein